VLLTTAFAPAGFSQATAPWVGKIVGEPTAGWIIYTTNQTMLDGSTVRCPSSPSPPPPAADEMFPRPVDVEVTRELGEDAKGSTQLEAAVQVLLRRWKPPSGAKEVGTSHPLSSGRAWLLAPRPHHLSFVPHAPGRPRRVQVLEQRNRPLRVS
jgi:hypothetical protein